MSTDVYLGRYTRINYESCLIRSSNACSHVDRPQCIHSHFENQTNKPKVNLYPIYIWRQREREKARYCMDNQSFAVWIGYVCVSFRAGPVFVGSRYNENSNVFPLPTSFSVIRSCCLCVCVCVCVCMKCLQFLNGGEVFCFFHR